MKCNLVLALFAVFTMLSGEVVTPDWNSIIAEKNIKQNRFYLKDGKKNSGLIMFGSPESLAKAKLEFKDRSMFLDTSESRSDDPKNWISYHSASIPVAMLAPLQKYEMSLAIKGTPGSKVKLFFEGSTKTGKHYWRANNFILDGSGQIIKMEQVLPENLRELHLRFDLATPGIYQIGTGEFQKVRAARYDTTRNYIVNGGAELGWYNTGCANMSLYRLSSAKEHLTWDGKSYTGDARYTIDSNQFRSGSNAFKIEAPSDAMGRFGFNPVPTVPGEHVYFSVWMKAGKPKTPASVTLYLASGTAYTKNVILDTKWKKIELDIPSWGNNAPGVTRIGDPLNCGGAVYHLVTPRIDIDRNNTIWFDDAFYTIGGKGEYKESAKLSVSGSLDKSYGYYLKGEKPVVTLNFKNQGNLKTNLEITWLLLDYFGKEQAKGTLPALALNPGETVKKCETISLPPTLRGPLNLCWEIKDSAGKTQTSYNFYFGIVERTGDINPRSGLNIHTEQNVETLIPMFRDFRLGSVRLWNHYNRYRGEFRGFHNIPAFHKAGFFVMMCLSEVAMDGDPGLMVPKDLSRFQAKLAQEAGKVRGQVNLYEILNEPNIWAGRKPNPNPEKYNQMNVDENIRINQAVKETLSKADPNAKLGGAATCHTDIAWTSNVLAKSADIMDAITEHPYRERPELPDYEEDLQNLFKMLKRYPKQLPVYASESGRCIPYILPENRIDETIRNATARDIRVMLIAFANGVEQYYQFAQNAWDAGTLWSVWQQGNPENDFMPRPAPYLFASKIVIDQIGKAKPLGRIKLGLNYRCYLFDDGAERVAVLWKWNGSPDTLKFNREQTIGINAFDMVGSSIKTQELPMNENPIYLRTRLSAKELEKRILSGKLTSPTETVAVTPKITGRNSFAVAVKNLTGTPISGKVNILSRDTVSGEMEKTFRNIPGEAEQILEFKTKKDISTEPISVSAKVETNGRKQELSFALKAVMPEYAPKKLAIDGELKDWPSAEPILLDSRHLVKRDSWKKEDAPVKAELRFAWNEDELYLAVKVFKKNNCETGKGVSALYDGDGIQFAFDPLKNADPGQLYYQDDDYEYAIGAQKGKLEVFRQHVASVVHDGLEKKKGLIDSSEVRRAIKVTPEYTLYTLAFPRQSISPFRLQAGNSMRINLLVNINNGKDRIGYLEFSPGIGKKKQPGLFVDMVLLKKE